MLAEPATRIVTLRRCGDSFVVAVEPPTQPRDAPRPFETKGEAWSWASMLWLEYWCGFDDGVVSRNSRSADDE